MIKSEIIHPELIGALAKCGHKTQILIADSNYAVLSNTNPKAQIIYLNFAKNLLDATTILDRLLKCINVESATMMEYPQDFDNTIVKEFTTLLGNDVPVNYLPRQEFYNAVKSDNTALVIASGETRRFANIILTVGVVKD